MIKSFKLSEFDIYTFPNMEIEIDFEIGPIEEDHWSYEAMDHTTKTIGHYVEVYTIEREDATKYKRIHAAIEQWIKNQGEEIFDILCPL